MPVVAKGAATTTSNDWLKTLAVIVSIVMSIATFGSMWMSFDRRVTENTNGIAALNARLVDHKTEESHRLDRMEGKLDRLIERSEK